MIPTWGLILMLGAGVADDGNQPHLAIDGDGTLYVTFIRDGNIMVRLFSKKGEALSSAVLAMDANGKAQGGMQRGPRIAVDSKKMIYVTAPICFDPKELTREYPARDLYLAVSADGGKTFSKPAMINDAPKKAAEALHWTAVAPSGELHVMWLDNRQGQARFLAYSRVTEQGKKIGKNVLLAGPLCDCCAPGLAVDGKGNPVAVYREAGGGTRQIYFGGSTNGGSSFGKFGRVNQVDSRVAG